MTMTLEELREACSALPIGNRYVQFADSIDSAIRERADLWSKWQTERCFRAKAEAELAALKARIANSRTTDVFESEGHAGMVAMGGLPCEWIGKNVRLVVED